MILRVFLIFIPLILFLLALGFSYSLIYVETFEDTPWLIFSLIILSASCFDFGRFTFRLIKGRTNPYLFSNLTLFFGVLSLVLYS